MLTLELVLLEPKTQVSGVVAIVDFDDLSFKQIFAASPGYASMVLEFVTKNHNLKGLKNLIKLWFVCSPQVQHVIPARVGGLRIVNNSYLFNIVFGILNPFLSQEFTDNLFLENSDFERLIKAVGKDSLEKRYGGTMSNSITYGKLTFELADKYRSQLQGKSDEVHFKV